MNVKQLLPLSMLILFLIGVAYSYQTNTELVKLVPWEQFNWEPDTKKVQDTPTIEDIIRQANSARPIMSNNPCDAVSLADLNGVPNFPELDELVVCSGPDTMSLLIYNSGSEPMTNVQITINYDFGLSYGGFVGAQSANNSVGELDVNDPLNPTFSVSDIPANGSVTANIAIQADCNIDLEGGAVNFDAQLAFTSVDATGNTVSCEKSLTEVGEYNNAIKVPVINVLSVTPQELTLIASNTPRCQTVLISQDGLGAFVDEMTFEITGLDTVNYPVSSFEINGSPYPYTYDDTTLKIQSIVSGAAFNGNTGSGANSDVLFDENERLEVEICYSVEGCVDENGVLDFAAYYGCNGDVCFDVSSKEGAVAFVPNYGATPVVSSGNIQFGTICGDNLMFDLTIQSANPDPVDGLWNSLTFKYDACILDNTEVERVQIGGVDLDTAHWYIDGLTLVVDLTGLTTDIDGPGGVEDLDGDGFFDDMPGGNTLLLSSELSIGCADNLNCGALECDLTRIEVSGRRNCNQPFQQFAPIDPVSFNYGQESTSTNAVQTPGFGIPITERINTVCDVWGATNNGYEFSYEFGSENIGACANPGGIKLVVDVRANGKRPTDIRYTDGSATYEGAAVPGTTWSYTLENGSDTVGLRIEIPAGDPTLDGVQAHDYFFNLDFRGDCYPFDYMSVTMQVIEECNSCGVPGGCEIVRACENASSYVDWNGCNCICDIRPYVDTMYRTNYGYADRAMTQKLTIDDVPEADRTRFLPGDTAFMRVNYEILNAQVLYESDTRWDFNLDFRGWEAPVIHDPSQATFLGWFYKDGATGQVTEIGIPLGFQNYPDSTRDNFTYPSIMLDNFGVEHGTSSFSTAGSVEDFYRTCLADPNINPNYPASSAVNYRQFDASAWDEVNDRMRINVNFGEPEQCIDNGSTAIAGGSKDHFNTTHADFLAQFPLKDGDEIYFEVRVPMMHNPNVELAQINGVSNGNVASVIPSANVYSTSDQCVLNRVAGSCPVSFPYQGHLPGPVEIEPVVTVSDCDVNVEYEFTLKNLVPIVDPTSGELPWYENEFRPYMATDYLELMFPNNMAMISGATIVMPDGSEVPLPSQYINDEYGNLTCTDDGSGGVCCVAEDGSQLASMRINDNDFDRGVALPVYRSAVVSENTNNICDVNALVHIPNDPFPHLLVGGGDTTSSYGLKYDLTAICPEEVESTDFEIRTQFSEPYVPSLPGAAGSYISTYLSGGALYESSNGFYYPINPFGTLCDRDSEPDPWGCVYFYEAISSHPINSSSAVNPMRQNDSIPTTPDNFTDNSQSFPPLYTVSDNFMLLIADAENASEFNTYEVCTGTTGGTATHINVVTAVTLPNSVDLLSVKDETGVDYTYTLVNSTSSSKTYSISMDDMPPGTCYQVVLETELLFCPVGLDIDTEVCLRTISGCLDPTKAAQIIEAGGGSCGSVGNCFEYVANEAELQVEWDIDPAGLNGLCDTVDFGSVIKNVKVATLTDIDAEWYFPAGMRFVPGSWEVSYPGGPGNMAAAISIPDPVADPTKNNIRGEYFAYLDAGVWSQSVNTMGLPGILSGADSNFVAFRFRVYTVCDDFVSGTSPWFQANGADPCESRVRSMLVDSEPIIINNANPFDFPQFFVFADPLDLYCGVEDTIELTYLNIAPIGSTQDAEVCIELDVTDLDYAANTASMISPAGFDPAFTESQTGNIIKICGAVPNGIGPGQAFRVGLPITLPATTACGIGQIGVGVSSTVRDQSCSAPAQTCDVGVLNSVNPAVEVNFLPPVGVSEHLLSVACDNDPANLTFDYSASLFNSGDPYTDQIQFEIVRDLNMNGILDEGIDPVVATETRNLTIPSGDTLAVNGQLTVPAGEACPVFLRVRQTTGCQCDDLAFLYDSFEPTFSVDLQDNVVLCPDSRFGIELCGEFDVSFAPAAGVTTTSAANGDSLYIEINDGFGLTSPVVMTVESQIGGCSAQSYRTEFRSLDDYEVGDYDALTLCNISCREIRIDLLEGFEDYATVEWTPNLYLDDNTSFSPTVCNPQADITYTVTVTINSGGESCMFTGTYPIIVEEQQTFDVMENGFACDNELSTFMGPAGYSNYTWYSVSATNERTIVQSGNDATFTTTTLGRYVLEYYTIGDICKNLSNTFEMLPCTDVALKKELDTDATIMPIRIGDNVVYKLTVYNQEASEVFDVKVSDYFPATSLSLNDPSWQISAPGVANYIGSELVGPIAGGDSVEISVTFTVLPGVNGEVVNYAEITQFDNDTDPNNAFPRDKDSTPDADNTNDAGGSPNTPADNVVTGDGSGAIGDGTDTTDEDDHDPATISVSALDFGDLPDSGSGVGASNYETAYANGGPAHIIVDGLYLGAGVDSESDGQPSTEADGDDADGDDEDGLGLSPGLNVVPGATLTLPLSAVNTTGMDGFIRAWIDWNGDGMFDASEMVADFTDGSGAFPDRIMVTVPMSAIQDQPLGVRVRLSNDNNLQPNGLANSGEIEDYLITVTCTTPACLPIGTQR